MTTTSNVRVLQKLHSHAKGDVLLCVRSSASDEDNQGTHAQHIVMKRLLLSKATTSKERSSSPTSIGTNQLTVIEAEESVVQEATQEAECVKRFLQLPLHPHIVRYYDAHVDITSIMVTMEHCPRGDLLTWLEQQPNHCFTQTQALHIFRQILLAVRFLHQHDIAHRDLSLENCLVTQDYTVKICDFGLATSASTPSTQYVGKLNYMAPEVVRGDLYDPVQADVWSLGVVLFILLTGSPLFQVASEDDVAYVCIQRVGIGGILKQWGLGDQVSESTVGLLSGMLCIDHEKRLRSVDEIMARIDVSVPTWSSTGVPTWSSTGEDRIA